MSGQQTPSTRQILSGLALFFALTEMIGICIFNSGGILTLKTPPPLGRCEVSGNGRGFDGRAGSRQVCKRQTPVKFVDAHPWCAGKPGQHLWTVNGTSVPNVTITSAPNTSGRNDTRNETYFLTAVVLVRIYANDLKNFTSNELIHWLQFMSYAGVEHVYLYDGYFYQNESQRDVVSCFIKSGFVTYMDWHHKAVDVDNQHRGRVTQQPAYQHCLETFGHQFVWQTATDIDEYPHCPSDRGPGFLVRLVHRVLSSWDDKKPEKVGQIYMQNFLFLGPPPDVDGHPILLDRFWNRTSKVWNRNVKPILLAKGVTKTKVHWNFLFKGYTSFYVPTNIVRMNHYQGARYYFDHEYDAKLKKTVMVEDRGMSTAVSMLELCRARCPVGCCI